MIKVFKALFISSSLSISHSAMTGNRAGMLLPFALGCMATYCLAYQGYCRSERIIVRLMALGFAIVAMQPCNSGYVAESRVGLLGLPPGVSNTVHGIGALIGFGLMFVWIACFFTRTSTIGKPTKQKIIRNRIYMVCAGIMFSGLALLAIGMGVDMGQYLVFIAEEFMLIPAGVAVVVKSGMVLGDK